MDLRSELLKSIWYGFTALDLEKSGKVSKSQLKVSGEPFTGELYRLVSAFGVSALSFLISDLKHHV